MVEVVVPLAKYHESGEDVVPGAVTVIKRLVAEPVGKGVHTECSLLYEEHPEDTSVDKTTEEVIPPQAATGSSFKSVMSVRPILRGFCLKTIQPRWL